MCVLYSTLQSKYRPFATLSLEQIEQSGHKLQTKIILGVSVCMCVHVLLEQVAQLKEVSNVTNN